MNIELTINAGESLIRFAEIIAGGFSRTQTPAPALTPATVAEQVTAPATTKSRKAASATPTTEAKVEEKPEVKEEAKDEVEEKVLTIETVRAATQEKAQAGKRDGIKALLSEFGVPRVTELPEAELKPFYEKLTAL